VRSMSVDKRWGIGSAWRFFGAANRLHKKVSRRLNRTSNETTLKRMITTKAIAFPSGGFPSMWTRIELYSSAEATTTRQYALACRRSTACQQCMKHSSTLGCAALARSNSHLSEPAKDVVNALVAHRLEQSRRARLRARADHSRQALALARTRYADGVTEFISVLDAQRSLLQAE
jgi:hypothetical protein